MEKIKEYWWVIIIAVVFFIWYNYEPKPEDYWCNELDSQSEYCHKLYDKVIERRMEYADYQESQGRSGEYDPRL